MASKVKRLTTNPATLGLLLGGYMVERIDSCKLFSDMHTCPARCTCSQTQINTCNFFLKVRMKVSKRNGICEMVAQYNGNNRGEKKPKKPKLGAGGMALWLRGLAAPAPTEKNLIPSIHIGQLKTT